MVKGTVAKHGYTSLLVRADSILDRSAHHRGIASSQPFWTSYKNPTCKNYLYSHFVSIRILYDSSGWSLLISIDHWIGILFGWPRSNIPVTGFSSGDCSCGYLLYSMSLLELGTLSGIHSRNTARCLLHACLSRQAYISTNVSVHK